MIAIFKSILGWEQKSDTDRYLFKYRARAMFARAISPLPLTARYLLRLFGSDKEHPEWHAYGRTYDRLFRSRKYRRIKILEIGIGGYGDSLGGQSLLAWRGFFPFGTIIGCDIEERSALSGMGCRTYRIDQASDADLTMLCAREGPFDIIIDDGSHLSRHQIFTFERLFDSLSQGGLYIVEDVQTSFWSGIVGNYEWDGKQIDDPEFHATAVGYFQRLAAYLNHAEFLTAAPDTTMLALARRVRGITFEHNLIIIEQGKNDDGSILLRRAPRPIE